MKLMLIDGHSLAFRAFYALPTSMTAPDGRCTNAVHGFLSMLFKALDEYRPDALAVAFDVHAPTFRHEIYPDYKGTRKPAPPEFHPQVPMLKEILQSMGICVVEKEGYEADDILGTLSLCAQQAGNQAFIITGDGDSLQLVSDRVHVLLTKKGLSQIEEYSPEHLMEDKGLTPQQIPDLKGLMGDSSDNIPGIAGVGEKTALSLLERFGTVEGVLEHADEIKGKMSEKVKANAKIARFSRQLAVIDRQVPLEIAEEDLLLPDAVRMAQALPVLEQFGLNAAAHRLMEAAPTAEIPEVPREIVELLSKEDLKKALESLGDGPVALALEDGISFALSPEKVYLLPLMVNLASPGWFPEDAIAALKPLLTSDRPKILVSDDGRKTGSAGRRWFSLCKDAGFELAGLTWDLTLMGYLLDASAAKLDGLALYERYLHSLSGPVDAGRLVELKNVLLPKLEELGMAELYMKMELPLVELLYRMEQIGFTVNRDALTDLGTEMAGRIELIQKEIYALAGCEFNVQSPKQLGEVLFEKMGLPAARKTKSGYSTDAEVLEGLEHPIAAKVLDYRQLAKLKGTYVDGMVPLLDRNSRLHTRFNQTLVATGRLSSAEPNLQNIPARSAEGLRIRQVFTASDQNHVLVDADYSQIELRVLAHMAQDAHMMAAFRDGEDIHARTASQVFNVPLAEVTGAMRSAAKAVNFGIVYGISDFGLARQLGITRKQAADYIDRYLSVFDGVKAFMAKVIGDGREKGYVETLYHRRRPMPELKARDYNTRTAAERMAMNAPIQGTAADIIKLAMLAVDQALTEKGLHARLILQVHDELILDTPKEEAEAVCQLVKTGMEQVAALDVPLKADVHTGFTWMEAKQ